jgi:hypothetical protein
MTGAREDGAMGAVSAFLTERADLLLPLAAQLSSSRPEFESSVHGSSMAPAIPAGARIRVRIDDRSASRVGDIVFYLAGDGYTVHRVVHRIRRPSDEDYLLTEGDARFAPDGPVPCTRVVGTVVAVENNGVWQPPGQLKGPWHRRLVRALTLPLMIVMARISAQAADRFAIAFLDLETRARLARRWVLRRQLPARVRFELKLISGRVGNLVDRVRHPDVGYRTLDATRINALIPPARRQVVADAIADSLAASDNVGYFNTVSSYGWTYRHMPRGIPSCADLYPPNIAVLDFLAQRRANAEQEVILDFPCGIGALLVYARDLGFTRTYGFDAWRYVARPTVERFLQRFGVEASALATQDELAALPVTILTCVGFPLPMLMNSSAVWSKPSVRYILTDRMTRPPSLPGFRRVIEYAGLITVFERTP